MKFDSILKIVSEVTQIPIEAIISRSRKRELVQARNIYFKLATNYKTIETLEDIGKLVNKDHASVIYGTNKIQDDIDTNFANTVNLIDECRRKIKDLLSDLLSLEETVQFRDIDILLIKETNLIKIIYSLIYKHHESKIQSRQPGNTRQKDL